MELKTIKLYGSLGAKFGRVHRLAVTTGAEAVRALCALYPDFERYMMSSRKNGLTFAVFNGTNNLPDKEHLHHSISGEFRIAPVLVGSKQAGLFQTILGAVMVVVGVLISYFSAGTLSAFGAGLAKMGAAVMLGGIVQMLTPQPGGLKTAQDADNTPNYAFGGAVNTTAQGNPVGVLYGTREIGGALLSGAIIANEVSN